MAIGIGTDMMQFSDDDNSKDHLDVRLIVRDGRVARVDIRPPSRTEPIDAFYGMGLADIHNRVPALFPNSPIAHSIAAARAAEQACNVVQDASVESLRDFCLATETTALQLKHILTRWVSILGEKPSASALDKVDRLLSGCSSCLNPLQSEIIDHSLLSALVEDIEHISRQKVLGISSADWLAFSDYEKLSTWELEGESLGARFLGFVEAREWNCGIPVEVYRLTDEHLATASKLLGSSFADTFVASPDIDGICCETGYYVRPRYGHHWARVSCSDCLRCWWSWRWRRQG